MTKVGAKISTEGRHATHNRAEVAVVDRSDTWTEQDQRDLTTFSLQYAAELYPEEEELV